MNEEKPTQKVFRSFGLEGGRGTNGWRPCMGRSLLDTARGLLLLTVVLLFASAFAKGQPAERLFKGQAFKETPERLYVAQLLAPAGIRYFESPDSLQRWLRPGRVAFFRYCRQLDSFLGTGLPFTASVSSSWQEADRAYRNFSARHRGHPWMDVFRQYGAYQLLVCHALIGDSSAGAMAAVVYYLRELLKAHSQNVVLFEAGITALKGHYPDIKRYQLARQMLAQLESEGLQKQMIEAEAGSGDAVGLSDTIRRQMKRWQVSRGRLLAFVEGVQCGCSATP